MVKNHKQKLRFALVGLINTGLDFGIYLALGLAGLPAVAANYISTTSALSFSFFANKKYTFQSKGGDLRRETMLFLVFTLIGLWILQPLVIWGTQRMFVGFGTAPWLSLVAAKLLSTCVSLVWNYFTYSRYVFPERTAE